MSRMRALLSAALAVVALAMVAACGGGEEEPSVTVTTPEATSTASRTPRPTSTPPPSQTPSADAVEAISALKEFVEESGYPEDATFARLRIPTLGVDTPVRSRFVGGDGVMPDPVGPADAIWYEMRVRKSVGGGTRVAVRVCIGGRPKHK